MQEAQETQETLAKLRPRLKELNEQKATLQKIVQSIGEEITSTAKAIYFYENLEEKAQ